MINLTPILNTKELKRVKEVQMLPYSQIYKKNDETELYNITKAVRKDNGLENKKLIVTKPDTFGNMIYTKAKDISPVNLFLSVLQGDIDKDLIKGVYNKIPKDRESIKKGIEVSSYLVAKGLAPVSNAIMSTQEKLGDIVTKPISNIFKGGVVLNQGAKGIFEEIRKNIIPSTPIQSNIKTGEGSTINENPLDILKQQTKAKENIKIAKDSGLSTFQRGILNTADDYETNIAKTNIFFGHTNSYTDLFDFTSKNEKRNTAINSIPGKKDELQKFKNDNANWILATDVASQVAGGFLVGGGITKVASSLGVESTIGKTISTLGEVIQKHSLTPGAIIGATQALSAFAYYNATGKYIYDGDEEATNAMLSNIMGGALQYGAPVIIKGVVKGVSKVGEGISATDQYINSLIKNPEVKYGYDKMVQGLKESLGNKVEEYVNKTGIVPRIIDETKTIKTPTNIIPKLDEQIQSIVNSKEKEGLFSGTVRKLKESGYYNEEHTPLYNYLTVNANKLKAGYLENRINTYAKKSGFSQKDIYQLNQFRNDGDLVNALDSYNRILKGMDDEQLKNLNLYMSAKSRYTQSVNKGGDLITTYPTNKGTNEVFNTEGLGRLISNFEKDGKQLNIDLPVVAENIGTLNKFAIKNAYNSGLISKAQLEAFNKNPYYIPAKLNQESLDNIGEDFYDREIGGLFKKLKEGTDEYTYSLDGLSNLFDYHNRIYKASKTNNFLKEMYDLNLKAGKDISVGEGISVGAGNTKVPVAIDGIKKQIIIPNYIVDLIKGNKPSDVKILKWIRGSNSLLKTGITGPGNPIFAVSQSLTEMLQGQLMSKAYGGGVFDFTKSQIERFLDKTVGKVVGKNQIENDALSALVDVKGASYAGVGGTAKELLQEVGGAPSLIKSTSKLYKGFKMYTDFLSSVDKWGSRAPAFISNVYSQAKENIAIKISDITKELPSLKGEEKILKEIELDDLKNSLKNDKFKEGIKKEIAKFYDEKTGLLDGKGVSKALEDKFGVDTNKSAEMVRNIFDYNAAGTYFQTLGRYIPYANLAPASLKSLVQLTKGNKKVIGLVAGAYTKLAYEMYSHNFALDRKDDETDKQRSDRKKSAEALRMQKSYNKYQPGYHYIGTDGNSYFLDYGFKNNVLYTDIIYPVMVGVMEGLNGRGVNIAGMTSKAVSDFTSVVDTAHSLGEFLDNEKSKLTPQIIKNVFSTILNTNYDYGTPVYNKGAGKVDTKGASPLSLLITGVLSKFGIDSNPKAISNLIKGYDLSKIPITKKFTDMSANPDTLRELEITGEDIDGFTRFLGSVRRITETKVTQLQKESGDIIQDYSNWKLSIKNSLDINDTKEFANEAKDLLQSNLKLYGPKDKHTEYILGLIQDKLDTVEGVTKLQSTYNNLGADVLAKILYNTPKAEVQSKFLEISNSIPEKNRGKKVNDMLNEMVKLKLLEKSK